MLLCVKTVLAPAVRTAPSVGLEAGAVQSEALAALALAAQYLRVLTFERFLTTDLGLHGFLPTGVQPAEILILDENRVHYELLMLK